MPTLQCDLVMKGGVTSGTVYPKAIVRLAKDYRFRSIGGTSAGAIAAGVAAAAEFRRQKSPKQDSMDGFALLAALPDELGRTGPSDKQSKLLKLFQPQRRFRRLLGFLLSLIGTDRDKKGAAKQKGLLSKVATWLLIGRIALKAICSFPVFALIGALAAVGVLYVLDVPVGDYWRLAAGVFFVLGGATAGAFFGVWRAVQALSRNGFGLCRGYEPAADMDPTDTSQLTSWLHDLIQRTAGRTVNDPPLTFGELTKEKIELRAMTTNLCYGLPQRLPFGRGGPWAFFDAKAWAMYFPSKVIEHMKARPPGRSTNPKEGNDKEYAAAVKRIRASQDLYPVPAEDDFPVIAAVRLSLSFPLLLSAVPIHMLDPRKHADGVANKCWFSDGGISSNFPLHFFDSPIPGRPTFAINLQEVDRTLQPGERVTLPRNNREGLERAWKGIPEDDATTALSGFLLAIFNVMQNWRDNSLLRMPGYRDRVASVQLEPHEGGLNLNMPEELITKLAGYGEDAAELLAKHFLPTNAALCKAEGIETTWENHRWVRLLTALAGLQQLTTELKNVWPAVPGADGAYDELLDPKKTPVAPSYPDFTDAQRDFALKTLVDVQAAIDACRAAMPGVPPMSKNTPRPAMHFRLTQES